MTLYAVTPGIMQDIVSGMSLFSVSGMPLFSAFCKVRSQMERMQYYTANASLMLLRRTLALLLLPNVRSTTSAYTCLHAQRAAAVPTAAVAAAPRCCDCKSAGAQQNNDPSRPMARCVK